MGGAEEGGVIVEVLICKDGFGERMPQINVLVWGDGEFSVHISIFLGGRFAGSLRRP